jgi:23S rRNA (cytidine1920-2'-O)/16S rRNA (cytidine1409-2'-O)-methyltransferase
MERTNVRKLDPAALDPLPTLIVADLAFTSLRSVLPSLLALATRPCEMVLLVKPQFELEREHLESGVVHDPVQRKRALERVEETARSLGLVVRGAIESPVPGADGNVEWLLVVSAP